MNTKSFVNGLDPENTVKGYYDENDQLVMVEPEGSGGGGDFTTCVLKTTGDFNQETDDRRINIAHVVDFDSEAYSQGSTLLPTGDNELTVVLYKGKAYMDFANENNPLKLDVVSGGAEPDIDGFSFYITGDCVFKKRTT